MRPLRRRNSGPETPKLQSMSYGVAQTLRSVFLAPSTQRRPWHSCSFGRLLRPRDADDDALHASPHRLSPQYPDFTFIFPWRIPSSMAQFGVDVGSFLPFKVGVCNWLPSSKHATDQPLMITTAKASRTQ